MKDETYRKQLHTLLDAYLDMVSHPNEVCVEQFRETKTIGSTYFMAEPEVVYTGRCSLKIIVDGGKVEK